MFFFLRDLDGNGDACIREDIQECLKACRHLTINPHTHSGVDLMNRVFVSLRFPLWGSCVKIKNKNKNVTLKISFESDFLSKTLS